MSVEKEKVVAVVVMSKNMFISYLSVCVWVCLCVVPYVWQYPQWPEEGIGFRGAEATGVVSCLR